MCKPFTEKNQMKYKSLFLFIIAIIFVPFVIAQDQVDLYLFYGKTCPHCRAEAQFLNSIQDNYPELVIHDFEVSNNENVLLWIQMCEAYGIKPGGVPTTFIGDEHITGFASHIKSELEDKIKECSQEGCPDPGEKIGKPSKKINPTPLPIKRAQSLLVKGISSTLKTIFADGTFKLIPQIDLSDLYL